MPAKWCGYWVDAGLDCNNVGLPDEVEKISEFYKIYELIKKNGW